QLDCSLEAYNYQTSCQFSNQIKMLQSLGNPAVHVVSGHVPRELFDLRMTIAHCNRCLDHSEHLNII
ncbi:hypothetical protein NL493_28630, partial [Klebsiella pneumoniae]|nr:hypothetical protein [Klebsiella pneumoniae]